MLVLVTCASKHEGTQGIATELAETLVACGLEVDHRLPGDVHELEGYDAVVLGSAIYAGEWLPEANDFVERFDSALRRMPVWLFSSGPLGEPAVPRGEPKAAERLLARLLPRDYRSFAGRLERDRLGVVERSIASVTHAPYGDFRDWPAIRAWARGIAAALADPAHLPASV